jgi:hypothetical protein
MRKRLSDPPVHPEEKMSVALGRDPPRVPPQSKTPTDALMLREGIQKWLTISVKMEGCDSSVGTGEGIGSRVGSAVGVNVDSRVTVWVGVGTEDLLSGDELGTGCPPPQTPTARTNAPTSNACITGLGNKRSRDICN